MGRTPRSFVSVCGSETPVLILIVHACCVQAPAFAYPCATAHQALISLPQDASLTAARALLAASEELTASLAKHARAAADADPATTSASSATADATNPPPHTGGPTAPPSPLGAAHKPSVAPYSHAALPLLLPGSRAPLLLLLLSHMIAALHGMRLRDAKPTIVACWLCSTTSVRVLVCHSVAPAALDLAASWRIARRAEALWAGCAHPRRPQAARPRGDAS